MAAVTFLFPMVLGAAGAAALPVVIHLILRTKPRKLVFPAMRFVRHSHRANLSKLRLKHLILLLMRMMAIVLLALLIARARIPRWTSVADRTAPAAAVFIVDNSASMGYVHRGQSLLARGKQFARQVIDSLPPGSLVAVLPTQGQSVKVGFQSDGRLIAEQVAAVEATCGARPVAVSLLRAAAMLREADRARKEIYVVSDMTKRSWRDLKAIRAEGIDVIVLNCGSGEDANISLGEVNAGESSVPRGTEVVLETLVRSMQVGGEVDVRVELNGRLVDSQPVELRPGSAVPVWLSFSPETVGLAHGRVMFRQDDPLAMDNVRYFTLQVGPAARALIVRDPATVGRGEPTSFLMGHALAPAGRGAGKGHWIERETITADRLDGSRLAGTRIVLLADVSSLSQRQWGALAGYVGSGGNVWIVIGSLVSAASYNSPAAQRILPAAIGELEILRKRIGFGSDNLSEPALAPFASDANPPLSEIRCQRRLRLASLAGDAHVSLRYADEKPAIVTRSIGAGSVVLWNFSPVREFSNLVSLAQFPILVQRTARLLAAQAGTDTAYAWGQTASVARPGEMPGAMVTVRRPGSAAEEPLARTLEKRVVNLRGDRLGHWTVEFAEGDRRVRRGFSVNADVGESDLTVADSEKIALAIGSENLVIVSDPAELSRRRRTVTLALDLAIPVLLALLALMTAESFFANRFYRQDDTQEGAAQGP